MIFVIWFLWMAFYGVVIGGLARWLMPGDDSMSMLSTSALGIGGSIVGGILHHLIGPTFFPSFIFCIAGAVIILVLVRVLKKQFNV